MNLNKLDIPHWVNKLVDNAHTKMTYKDNLILPVSISADIIKKSTFKNKYHTILAFQVLNREVTNQLLSISKKFTK